MKIPFIGNLGCSFQYLRRKETKAPFWFENYSRQCDFKELFSQNPPPVGIDLWRGELHHVCTTLVWDELLDRVPGHKGELYLMTFESGFSVENYVNLGIIEKISSGIKYKGSFLHQGFDVMVLEADANRAKDHLEVPQNCFLGYDWYPKEEKPRFQKVPASALGGRVVLNFAVCGEFNLYVFFHEPGSRVLTPVFKKMYCCK